MEKVFVKIARDVQGLQIARKIREEVFQKEQGVGVDLDFDGKDEICDQLIALCDGQPAGTARIRYLNENTAKLERMAVLLSKRKNGIGKAIVEFAIEYSRKKGTIVVELHSQVHAQKFYEKFGFEPIGELFDDGTGILHRKMKLILAK